MTAVLQIADLGIRAKSDLGEVDGVLRPEPGDRSGEGCGLIEAFGDFDRPSPAILPVNPRLLLTPGLECSKISTPLAPEANSTVSAKPVDWISIFPLSWIIAVPDPVT